MLVVSFFQEPPLFSIDQLLLVSLGLIEWVRSHPWAPLFLHFLVLKFERKFFSAEAVYIVMSANAYLIYALWYVY